MSNLRNYIKDKAGMAAVESALVFPFLITAGFASMDASYMLLQSHKMESSLSTAANYLAQTPDPQSFEAQAKRLAATGQVKSGGSSLIPNWTENDVTIVYKNFANTQTNSGLSYRGGAAIEVIQVSSTLSYQGLGFLKAVNGGNINVGAQSEARSVGR